MKTIKQMCEFLEEILERYDTETENKMYSLDQPTMRYLSTSYLSEKKDLDNAQKEPRRKKIVAEMEAFSEGEGDNMLKVRKEVYDLADKIFRMMERMEQLIVDNGKFCNHPIQGLYHTGFGCCTGHHYSNSIICSKCGKSKPTKIKLDPDWFNSGY